MKNEGFLHCRFTLGMLLVWPLEDPVKIYNVKTPPFLLVTKMQI